MAHDGDKLSILDIQRYTVNGPKVHIIEPVYLAYVFKTDLGQSSKPPSVQ
jgi:hypothetical protein